MPDDLSQPIPAAPIPVPPVTPPSVPPIPPVPPVPSAPPAPPPPEGITPPAHKSPKIKIGLAILSLFLISVSVPLAVFLVKQRQEIRKEAVGGWASVDCPGNPGQTVGATVVQRHFETLAECQALCCNGVSGVKCGDQLYCGQGQGNRASCTVESGKTACTINAQETCGVVQVDCDGSNNPASLAYECTGCPSVILPTSTPIPPTATPFPTATATPPVVATPTPTATPPAGCYKLCTQGTTTCATGLVCGDTNGGFGIPLYACLNPACPGSSNCVCQAATPTPTGTPRPTATPTRPTATTTPGYGAACLTSQAYDTNWNQITPSSIQLNQTVYFATQGSTNQPQGITKARFRINGEAWQETTNKHGELFYIQYTVASARSYTVESMIFNPALGWY